MSLTSEIKKEIRKRESMHSLVTQMPGLAFLKTAGTGQYIACNQAFAEYAQKSSPEGVIGLTDHEIFDQKTADHFVEDDRITIRRAQPYVFFEDVPDAAGKEIRHLQTTKLKFTDSDGRVCVLGMCVDITDYIRLKQEKQKAMQAYEKVRTDSLTYSSIAQALSADYDYLYYVNLATDEFTEFDTVSAVQGKMSVKRKADHFFEASLRDAERLIYIEDRERFSKTFTKENVLRILDEQGTFILNYRLMTGDTPVYVSMKASRMQEDEGHVVIGVTDIDKQVRQEEDAERMRQEQIAYSRIAALSGDYICIYTIDPVTNQYTEYSSTSDYENLGFAKEGDDFFERARLDAEHAVWPEDLEWFLDHFTRERVMEGIRKNGAYSLRYRLILNGAPVYVRIKLVPVQEQGGERLIAGVNNIDAQVRRDQEYEHNLAEARKKASRDALTGLKNKLAWTEATQRIDRQIAEGKAEPFALTMFDLNGLKEVNDSRGHQAGDEYLQAAGAAICDLFKHSPVFRIGGDEFAAISQGHDYEMMDQLLEELMQLNRRHLETGEVVIAAGTARYQDDPDTEAVFARADSAMYRNKKLLASMGAVQR